MKQLNPQTKFRVQWTWANGRKQSMHIPYAILENTINAICSHPSIFDVEFVGNPEFKGLYFSNNNVAVELSENAIVE